MKNNLRNNEMQSLLESKYNMLKTDDIDAQSKAFVDYCNTVIKLKEDGLSIQKASYSICGSMSVLNKEVQKNMRMC